MRREGEKLREEGCCAGQAEFPVPTLNRLSQEPAARRASDSEEELHFEQEGK